MKTFTKVMKALSDANRIKIIKMLQRKPMCVCELQSALQIAQPTVSKHLKILEDAQLVQSVKDGLWVDYYLSDGPVPMLPVSSAISSTGWRMILTWAISSKNCLPSTGRASAACDVKFFLFMIYRYIAIRLFAFGGAMGSGENMKDATGESFYSAKKNIQPYLYVALGGGEPAPAAQATCFPCWDPGKEVPGCHSGR